MKKKLKLDALKVQSFVTAISNDKDLKGGVGLTGTETWNFPCTHGGTLCDQTKQVGCFLTGTETQGSLCN